MNRMELLAIPAHWISGFNRTPQSPRSTVASAILSILFIPFILSKKSTARLQATLPEVRVGTIVNRFQEIIPFSSSKLSFRT